MPTRSLRPRLEPLEDRVTPAYSATFSGTTATFVGGSSGGSGDVIVFSQSGGLLVQSRGLFDAGFNSEFDFDSTVAGDQTLVASAASVINLTTGTGPDQIQVGGSFSSYTAAASTLLAQFNLTNGGAANAAVIVNDGASTTGNTFTYASNVVAATGVSVSFAGPAFGAGISLRTGTGNDTVNLTSVLAIGGGAEPRSVLNAGGNDNITVGSAGGSLDGFAGQSITVTGSAGTTAVVVNDSGDAGGDTYRVNATDVQREDGANDVVINHTGTGVSVSLNTGSGNDTIVMANGGSLSGGTIDAGAGTDTIDHTASTTAVAVNLGLGVTGLTATLDGGQENPGNGQPGIGTATFSNYNAITKTFDISVTVTNLNPALVTGYHIHRAGVGTNGPIIIPLDTLFGLGALIPSGTGFTFNATGVSLAASLLGGAANEAAFLGGQTYLNFHTAAFPGGEIRGQIFASANVNLVAGTATGTSGISDIENAIGGSGADSLVGSFAANTLSGLGGNDTILGGPGADTFVGGANDDVMIWSNGDGSDVMDGSTGTDTVAVNGSLTANDVFTVGANGSRVAFARVSPGPFTLDVGTVESLQVNGIVGDDSFTLNSLAGVADLTAVGLNGLAGTDTFTVTPFAGTTAVRGGVGQDTLTATTAGTTNPFVTTAADPAGGRFGGFAFGNRGPVNFTQTENPSAPANFVTVTVTDGLTTAITGTSILYTLTVTNSSALGVNGISVTDVLPAALTGVTWAAVFTAGSTGIPGGSGNINQQVNLAAGGSVTYSIVATISPAFAGSLTNTASAAVPAGLTDDTPADDTATDTTTVTLPPVPPPPPLPPVAVDLFAAATGPGVPVQVNVFNANGKLRLALTPFGGFAGGASVATGDVTGDGIDDIAVGAGAGGGPHVKVFDGASGAEIQSFFAYDVGFHGGVFVGVGDTSADGRADVVTGAGAGGGPHVKVFDGRTWTERMSFFAYDPGFAGGVSVRAGDTNADGFADVVTGAGPGGGPHVRVVSGKDGSELQSFFAGDPTSTGGVFVGIGNFRPATALPEIVSSVNGVVRVFGSSAAGRPYIEQDSFVAFASGVKAVPAAVRLDDGIIAILIGAVGEVAPHVKIIDGTSSTLRSSFFAFDPAFLGGAFVG